MIIKHHYIYPTDKPPSIYLMPPKTLIGKGCLKLCGIEFKKLGVRKSLIVTDAFLAESGLAATISDLLGGAGIESRVFPAVEPNPTFEIAQKVLQAFLDAGCDSLISLGGGSAHDTAKAAKIVLLQSELGSDLPVPHMAVNTTAGTAAEMSKIFVITDAGKHHKIDIADERIVPEIAVNDPEVMVGMSPKLTAATGMDALTHAIEAYTCRERNDLTDCQALGSIILILDFLYDAYRDGKNIIAREKMAVAEYLAGMAFSNAGLGLVHAMSHQLSGVYNLPHGVVNAVLLPYVMEYNFDASFKDYAMLAKVTGTATWSMSNTLSARKFIQQIKSLRRRLQIPDNIRILQVREEDFDTMAGMAMEDNCFSSNVKTPTRKEIINIYRNAYQKSQSF